MLLDIEVQPAAHIAWVSEAARAEWAPRIKEIGAAHYRTEIEMVVQGHRACTTANLAPQSFEHDLEGFAQKGLIFLPIRRTKRYTGFSHKHVPTTGQDPDSMVYGVVARRLRDAEAFRAASAGKEGGGADHRTIGRLLGYPDCCIEAFDRTWTGKGSGERWFDTIYQQALATHDAVEIAPHVLEVAGHPFCNQALRYFGIRITSHLPCSWDCPKTISWGEAWYQTMQEINPQAAADALYLLSLPVEWNALKGIVTCKTDLFLGIANSVPCYPAHVVRYTPVSVAS